MNTGTIVGDQGQATTRMRDVIDKDKLIAWMEQQQSLQQYFNYNVNNSNNNDINIRQFGFGQSNPTYKITIFNNGNNNNDNSNNDNTDNNNDNDDDDNNTIISFVLRKKPIRIAHKSAHALHREYYVLKALEQHNNSCSNNNQIVPVPKVYVYCNDSTILGSEFYIMEYINGRIYTNPTLPGMSKTDRQIAYDNIIQVLSSIHSVNIHNVGLSNYGSRKKSTTTTNNNNRGYVQRQLDSLLAVSYKQAELSGEELPNEMKDIAEKLKLYASYCPGKNIQTTLIHGDYKIDNIIFHTTKPIIIGVLDWELSTLGDPLSDLANISMMYYIPNSIKVGITGLAGNDNKHNIKELGIPTRKELVHTYCNKMNNNNNNNIHYFYFNTIWEWSGFYLSFLFFKNCVIVHGVAQRVTTNTASSANAKQVATLLPTITKLATYILYKYPPPPPTSNSSTILSALTATTTSSSKL